MKTLDEMDKDFGAFYPLGHLVVAFGTYQNAEQVLAELQTHAPLFDETVSVTPQAMIAFAEVNINEAGIIANMGTSMTTVQKFLNAARTGSHFLVIPTPDDAVAAKATDAIGRVSHGLAQRYHLLAIEDVP